MDKIMKNILLSITLFLIISCDEEAPPTTQIHPLIGIWDATSISLEATFITVEEFCNGPTYSWINNKCIAVTTPENEDWTDMTWTFNLDNTLIILVVSEEDDTTIGTWSVNENQLTTITYDSNDENSAEPENKTGVYSITNNILEIETTMDLGGYSYPATFTFNRR